MSSTVRIDPEDKDVLRRLQEAWRDVRGEAPSQKELLARALAFVEARRDDFVAEAAWTPLTDEEKAYWRSRSTPWEGPASTEVDEVLYGRDRLDGAGP